MVSRVHGRGLMIDGFGCGVHVAWFGVQSLGSGRRKQGQGVEAQEKGSMGQGARFLVNGLRCRVY